MCTASPAGISRTPSAAHAAGVPQIACPVQIVGPGQTAGGVPQIACPVQTVGPGQTAGPGISIPNRLEKASAMAHRSSGRIILTRSTIATGSVP